MPVRVMTPTESQVTSMWPAILTLRPIASAMEGDAVVHVLDAGEVGDGAERGAVSVVRCLTRQGHDVVVDGRLHGVRYVDGLPQRIPSRASYVSVGDPGLGASDGDLLREGGDTAYPLRRLRRKQLLRVGVDLTRVVRRHRRLRPRRGRCPRRGPS
jgi:hypothetical protein